MYCFQDQYPSPVASWKNTEWSTSLQSKIQGLEVLLTSQSLCYLKTTTVHTHTHTKSVSSPSFITMFDSVLVITQHNFKSCS